MFLPFCTIMDFLSTKLHRFKDMDNLKRMIHLKFKMPECTYYLLQLSIFQRLDFNRRILVFRDKYIYRAWQDLNQRELLRKYQSILDIIVTGCIVLYICWLQMIYSRFHSSEEENQSICYIDILELWSKHGRKLSQNCISKQS